VSSSHAKLLDVFRFPKFIVKGGRGETDLRPDPVDPEEWEWENVGGRIMQFAEVEVEVGS